MADDITITATEGGEFPDIEAGAYAADITDIQATDGQFGAQVKFVFTLTERKKDDGGPIEMWAWASQKLSPQSKLWRWIATVTGEKPVVDQAYRVTQLQGRPCQILVNIVDTEQGPRPRVVDVLGPKRPRPGATAAPSGLAICVIPNCGEKVHIYDDDGNGFCVKHMPAEVAAQATTV